MVNKQMKKPKKLTFNLNDEYIEDVLPEAEETQSDDTTIRNLKRWIYPKQIKNAKSTIFFIWDGVMAIFLLYLQIGFLQSPLVIGGMNVLISVIMLIWMISCAFGLIWGIIYIMMVCITPPLLRRTTRIIRSINLFFILLSLLIKTVCYITIIVVFHISHSYNENGLLYIIIMHTYQSLIFTAFLFWIILKIIEKIVSYRNQHKIQIISKERKKELYKPVESIKSIYVESPQSPQSPCDEVKIMFEK